MSLKSYKDSLIGRENNLLVRVRLVDAIKTYSFMVSNKTRMKEIAHKLALQLDLDPIRTNFTFSVGMEVFKPTSTLLQNGIRNGDTIIAKMHDTGYNQHRLTTATRSYYASVDSKAKTMGSFGTTSARSFASMSTARSTNAFKNPDDVREKKDEIMGLKLSGACRNPKCIATKKKVTFSMGTGMFSVHNLLENTCCMVCKRPAAIYGIYLTNCGWKLEGNYYDANGFLNKKYMKSYEKVIGTDGESIFEKLLETQYVNPLLTIKGL